jgi:hypothetical protein
MAAKDSHWLVLLLLLFLAFLCFKAQDVFFALGFIVLAVFFTVVRIMAPTLPQMPKAAPAAIPPAAHADYNKMKAHIDRHTGGFGQALNNLGHLIFWAFNGFQKKK